MATRKAKKRARKLSAERAAAINRKRDLVEGPPGSDFVVPADRAAPGRGVKVPRPFRVEAAAALLAEKCKVAVALARAELGSRSVARRMAAQAGLPAPTFEGKPKP